MSSNRIDGNGKPGPQQQAHNEHPRRQGHLEIPIEPPQPLPPRKGKPALKGRELRRQRLTDSKPARGPVRRKRRFWPLLLLLAAGIIGAAALAGYHEVTTSRLQAKYISRYSAKLRYRVANGPSDAILFPVAGPYDKRLGYVQLPHILKTLEERGMEVSRQARFSPELYRYAQHGLHIPYKEKSQAGLLITDTSGKTMYRMVNPGRVYKGFYDIPYIVLQALLFIENRDLLSDPNPNTNPAVEWGRFAKAVFFMAGEKAGFDMPSMGGSTLATQTEKFRHSEGGRTSSPQDKLVQMASASVRAYHGGEDTTAYRRQLVLDYLNSVPLSAAPGYGEVNGLGDGAFVWYGIPFDEMNRLLTLREPASPEFELHARTFKQVLSLMIAHRRPSHYLFQGRQELATLTNSYIRLLAREGIVSASLSEAAQIQPLVFRDFAGNSASPQVQQNKGVNVVRNRLAATFDTSLYQLDRMDLSVVSTLDHTLQEQVSRYLRNLQEPETAEQLGLIGKYLLTRDQTDDISYSFTLFERTPDGNMVRVQTDTTQLPFDINEGSKLELGSTAKLRTLTTYLEVIADLHGELSVRPPLDLVRLISKSPDPLTLWVCHQLTAQPGMDLQQLLEAAMERTYSANPGERFFTGGGLHTFSNFRREDNNRYATVTASLQNSLNLPFVRIMRDIVTYTIAAQWENNQELLKDDRDPRRQELLDTFVDKESRVFLSRYWHKYAGQVSEQRLLTLLAGRKPTALRLTIIHRHLFPEADLASYISFIRKELPATTLSNSQLEKMFEKYRPGAYNLQDQGYLASIHPLELWLLDYLQHTTSPTLKDAVDKSRQTRKDVYGWLMRTKAKNARDSRIRTVLEIDAFSDIHQRWARMGYPFGQLVPSLATALGSSGDRPAALAELVGIILNDGRRLQTHRFTRLDFGRNTPYETTVVPVSRVATGVLRPEVAAVLKKTMAKVVSDGTGRRLLNTFQDGDSIPLVIGGKTGTGDNRIVASRASGYRTSSRALNRTATFVFYLGDNHFGTLTAFVNGSSANAFSFTSSLPLQVLKGMAPILQPYIQAAGNDEQPYRIGMSLKR